MTSDVRRWKPGDTVSLAGTQFRVEPGKKAPGDQRLTWRTSAGWLPVPMAVVFLMVDFFADNEKYLKRYRPNWREEGDKYFLKHVTRAANTGWEVVADEVRSFRESIEDGITLRFFEDDEA